MSDEQNERPDLRVVIFEGETIRRQWIEDRWFFSVVDVVGLLAESTDPRKYWIAMKARIQDEGFLELSTTCRQ